VISASSKLETFELNFWQTAQELLPGRQYIVAQCLGYAPHWRRGLDVSRRSRSAAASLPKVGRAAFGFGFRHGECE